MVVDLNCSLNNDFHSLYIHFHRLFDLSDNLHVVIVIVMKSRTPKWQYWLAHIMAYSHHDKIPPWWGNVSNDKGGNVSLSNSHHSW